MLACSVRLALTVMREFVEFGVVAHPDRLAGKQVVDYSSLSVANRFTFALPDDRWTAGLVSARAYPGGMQTCRS